MDCGVGETSGQSAAFLGDGCNCSVHPGDVGFGVRGRHHGIGHCWFDAGLDKVEALFWGGPRAHGPSEDVVPFFLYHFQGLVELGFPV